MIGRRIERDLGCCPTCRRPFRSVFDYPTVLMQAFEKLTPREARDCFSGQGTKRASARDSSRGRTSPGSLEDGTNLTSEIVDALARDEVRRYFDGLSALVGRDIEPERLRPGWEADKSFQAAYPISGTRLFLGFFEAEESSRDRGVVEVQVLCKGINFGSAGGPTLQLLGSAARISYRGLLAEYCRS